MNFILKNILFYQIHHIFKLYFVYYMSNLENFEGEPDYI